MMVSSKTWEAEDTMDNVVLVTSLDDDSFVVVAGERVASKIPRQVIHLTKPQLKLLLDALYHLDVTELSSVKVLK